MLFRRICPGCGAQGARVVPCRACDQHLTADRPIELRPPPGLDSVVALHRYDPVVRALVLAAKNGGRRHLLGGWGPELAALVDDWSAVDAVTWVPASRQGARSRGYDQGRLLARSAATTTGCAARRLLIRRRGPTRVGADRAGRLDGPDLRCPIVSPGAVIVIDDVLTTGSSLAAAARALRSAGAERVVGLVVAVAGNDPPIRVKGAGR